MQFSFVKFDQLEFSINFKKENTIRKEKVTGNVREIIFFISQKLGMRIFK